MKKDLLFLLLYDGIVGAKHVRVFLNMLLCNQ